MKFEVGDKVKITTSNAINSRLWNLICNVVEVKGGEYEFPYIISAGITGRLPVLANEIEKVATKGQQLLFSFMVQ